MQSMRRTTDAKANGRAARLQLGEAKRPEAAPGVAIAVGDGGEGIKKPASESPQAA